MDQKLHPDQTAADADAVMDARVSTTCTRCGTTRDGHPLTWTCSVENGVREYFCDDCARKHLRAIEGRLDSIWW